MSNEEIFLAEFESDLSDPVSYLQPSDHLEARCLYGVKNVFDFYKKIAAGTLQGIQVVTGPLTELYTDGFDNEQIWEEIELLNEPFLKSVKKHVKKVSAWENDSSRKTREVERTNIEPSDGDEDDYIDSEEEIESDEEESKVKRSKEKSGKKSIVDDRFFKLAEMEKFLELSEKQEEKDPDNKSDSGSEDIDYFVDEPSDNDSEADSTDNPHYNDFFDASDSTYQAEKKSKTKGKKKGKQRVLEDGDIEGEDGDFGEASGAGEDGEGSGAGEDGDLSDDGSDLDMEVDGGDNDDIGEGIVETPPIEDTAKQDLSTHEKKQLKMKKKISEMEEINLAPKSWQMGGETSGKKRPLNSLLAEDLSFEHMSRPAPVITEETTKTLEDIIKQRILDEAFDDVERKIKPIEKPYDYSRSRPLEQEKSKLSLAEVYEQEYLKQTEGSEEHKEDERHVEIRELMNKLFVKLDALSNFHFTPKPPKPDVKIVANVPAIQMEEVAPVAVSDATRLAPEELQIKSKRPQVGATEKSITDRKRDRRLKKSRKRLQIAEKKQREKVLEKLRPGLGNKFTRKSLEKKLKDREHDELVDKSLKSSSRFFAKLQEEVKEQVKSTMKGEDSRKNRTSSAQQFKL